MNKRTMQCSARTKPAFPVLDVYFGKLCMEAASISLGRALTSKIDRFVFTYYDRRFRLEYPQPGKHSSCNIIHFATASFSNLPPLSSEE